MVEFSLALHHYEPSNTWHLWAQ